MCPRETSSSPWSSRIATGALPPKIAAGIAALLNLVGAFISPPVAATLAEGIVEATAVTPIIVLAGAHGLDR